MKTERSDHERATDTVRDLINLLGRGVWQAHSTLPYTLQNMSGSVTATYEAGVIVIRFRDVHSQDATAYTTLRVSGWTYGTVVLLISQVATWDALASHHRDWPTGEGV